MKNRGRIRSRRWSRVVGYALHANPDPENIPCHRVVNRLGEISVAFAFGGENRQIALLESGGVILEGNRVNLEKYQWNCLGSPDYENWM